MSRIDVAQLAERLQKQVLRIPTGIVLIANDQLGREDEFVALLQGVGGVDLWKWKVERLTQGARYLGISEVSLMQDLHAIVGDASIHGNCLLVYNADVLISRLGASEQSQFWKSLLSHYRQKRGLMISLPQAATNLLTVDERRVWSGEGRLAYEGVDR